MPCACACVLAAAALAGLRRRRRRRAGRWLARALLCAGLTAGGARTLRRNLAWRDDASLFGAARRAYPGSAKATYQLGDLLAQASVVSGVRGRGE